MDGPAYDQLTCEISRRVQSEPGFQALVAVGSTASIPVPPDQYSDHDLFIVASESACRRLAGDPYWLPFVDRILWWFHEFPNVLKVFLTPLHLVEIAVVTPSEFRRVPTNGHTVVAASTSTISETGAQGVSGDPANPSSAPSDNRDMPGDATSPVYLWGQVVSSIYSGVAKYHRGERIAGHYQVRCTAVNYLVRLIHATEPAAHPELVDRLEPTRRLELTHPEQAGALLRATGLPVPECALALIEILERGPGSKDDLGKTDRMVALLTSLRYHIERSDQLA